MSPDAPCEDTALRMLPLFERGRAALKAYIARYPPFDRPVLGNMNVITRADFVANADLCLQHIERNDATAHVLYESGAICILVQKRQTTW